MFINVNACNEGCMEALILQETFFCGSNENTFWCRVLQTQYLKKKMGGSYMSLYASTVKPALVITCLQDHICFVSLENAFPLKHLLKEPVYKDHFLCFPWAVAIDKFDGS